MNGELWSKERDAQLRELREQGFSMGQIAVKLGVKRNAVIGRAHRMKLPTKQRCVPPKSVQKQEPRAPKRQSNPFKLLPPSGSVRQELTIDQQSLGVPITLFELQSHHCRWPVNDAPYMFCGDAKQDGSSYCEHHWSISRRRVANSY